jgi:hypothetical protein
MPESVSQQPILNKNDGRSYSEQRSLDGCGSPNKAKMGIGERLSTFDRMRNSSSFGLNDLEALLTVAHEAKAWIAAHVLKR